MDKLDCFFLVLIVAHLIVSPYTKVEESFNIHAVHDLLFHGRDLQSVRAAGSVLADQQYDHFEFPGVVPRTFVGAVVLAAASSPLKVFARSKFDLQYACRGALGVLNWAALVYFRASVRREFGKTTAWWFAVLQYTQFHITYYASRLLPNMIAFPIVMVASGKYVDRRPDLAVLLLSFAAVVFRCELAVLAGTVALTALVRRQIGVARVVAKGLQGLVLGAVVSAVVDSYFWGFPLLPEAYGFYFNVVLGRSSEWGVEPWHAYFSLHVPKLLLNPAAVPLFLIGLLLDRRATGLVLPYVAYVGVHSLQPHKEWRFIVYVVPVFTVACAVAAAWISNRMRKNASMFLTALLIAASAAGTLALSSCLLVISSTNYAGGHVVDVLHAAAGDFNRPVSAHLDVPTCMSGADLFTFTHANVTYDRSEQPGLDLTQFDLLATFDANPGREWTKVGSVTALKKVAAPWVKLGSEFYKVPRWWEDVVEMEDMAFVFAQSKI